MRRLSEIPPTSSRPWHWGQWQIIDHYLVHDPGGQYEYEINLHSCTDSASTLDWIMQIASKTWADPETVGNLVQALNRILEPQANLCSCGEDKKMSNRDVQAQVDSWLARPLRFEP